MPFLYASSISSSNGMVFKTVREICADMQNLTFSDTLDLRVSYESLYQGIHIFSKSIVTQGWFSFEPLRTKSELLPAFKSLEAKKTVGFKVKCIAASPVAQVDSETTLEQLTALVSSARLHLFGVDATRRLYAMVECPFQSQLPVPGTLFRAHYFPTPTGTTPDTAVSVKSRKARTSGPRKPFGIMSQGHKDSLRRQLKKYMVDEMHIAPTECNYLLEYSKDCTAMDEQTLALSTSRSGDIRSRPDYSLIEGILFSNSWVQDAYESMSSVYATFSKEQKSRILLLYNTVELVVMGSSNTMMTLAGFSDIRLLYHRINQSSKFLRMLRELS